MTDLPLLHQFELAAETPEPGASSWRDLLGNSFGDLVHSLLRNEPTAAQEQFIASAKAGRDLLFCVRTGGGKTVTLLVWILFQIWQQRERVNNNANEAQEHSFHSVVLLPTNSLLYDFDERLRRMAAHLGVSARIISYTSDASADERNKIRSQARDYHVVLLTPDMWKASMMRNWELGEEGRSANRAWASQLLAPNLLVFEEFDVLKSSALAALRLLLPIIRKAAANLLGLAPQIVLTSATATNPAEIREVLLPGGTVIMGRGRHGKLHILALSRFQRTLHGWEDKLPDLVQSCLASNPHQTVRNRILIVIDDRQLAEQIFQALQLADQGFGIVHGNLDAKRNRMTVERFKRGELRGLLATTIINRGIDVGDLNLLILVGIPVGGLRDVVQSLGRVARPPDAVGVVYHLLNRRRPHEEAFARDPCRLEALYEGAVAPVLVPLDMHHSLKLAILVALSLGCRARDQLPGLLPPEMWEWLPGRVVSLRAQGLLRYTLSQLTPTSMSGVQIHELPLRGSQRRFTVRVAETRERLGQIDVQQVARAGLPRDRLLLGGQSYRVAATSPTEVLVTSASPAEGKVHAISDNRTESSLGLTIRGVYHFGGLSFELCDVHPQITPTVHILKSLESQATVTESPIAPANRVHFSLDPIEGFTIQTSSEGSEAAQTLAYAMLAATYVEPPTDVQVLIAHDRVMIADRPGTTGVARDLYQRLPHLLPQVTTRLSSCSCHQAGCPTCVYLAAPPSWSTDRATIERTLTLLQKGFHTVENHSDQTSALDQPGNSLKNSELLQAVNRDSWKSLFNNADQRREVEVILADLHIGHPSSRWQAAISCLAQLLEKYRVFAIYFAGDTVELRFAHEAALGKGKEAKNANLAIGWQTVQSAFDDFTERLTRLGVDDRCVFITGNHDTRLELLPRSHGLVITQAARLDCDNYSVHVLHGHGLGLEAAAQRYEGGAAALRAVREQLERIPPPLMPRLCPADWLVIGHYGIGVCDVMSRVVGLGDWTGDLNNPVKACYAVVELANAEAPVRLGRWRHNVA